LVADEYTDISTIEELSVVICWVDCGALHGIGSVKEG